MKAIICRLKRIFGGSRPRQVKPLAPEVVEFLRIMQAPAKWQPAVPITAQDVKELAHLLETPLMRKLDVIMYNHGQQMMERAALGPTGDVLAAVKFAAGYKANWAAFKSLSVLDVTENVETEEAEQSGTAPLET